MRLCRYRDWSNIKATERTVSMKEVSRDLASPFSPSLLDVGVTMVPQVSAPDLCLVAKVSWAQKGLNDT